MALPPRVFYTIIEAAARWDCTPADIAGWAAIGKINFLTSVAFAKSGALAIAGLVALPASDIMPMFRRDGSGPATFAARRVKRITDDTGRDVSEQEGWIFVSEPEAGIPVTIADLLIRAEELRAFESDHGLTRFATGPAPGSSSRWDWEAMWVAVAKRLYESGIPASQNELVREMADWFARRSETGETPDESTIRRRLRPLWDEIRDGA